MGDATLKCLCQRGFIFHICFKWGLKITCHVTNRTRHLENKLWATFKMLLGYLSSLVTRNCQCSKMTEMGGGVQVP